MMIGRSPDLKCSFNAMMRMNPMITKINQHFVRTKADCLVPNQRWSSRQRWQGGIKQPLSVGNTSMAEATYRAQERSTILSVKSNVGYIQGILLLWYKSEEVFLPSFLPIHRFDHAITAVSPQRNCGVPRSGVHTPSFLEYKYSAQQNY